jgi:Ca-activated chloride channel family protein
LNQITLSLTPRRAALLDGADTEFEVLAAVRAPDAPATQAPRPPLNLAIVLDRSGSMAGRPLAEAKRCAEFIVEHLGPQDRTALVTFETQTEILVASTSARPHEPLVRAIRAIASGGQTALHEGWVEGAAQAAPYVADGAIARVLILTDGQANMGECRPNIIAADCARLAATGVSTSTYGLGQNFNEDLLGAMAEAGSGHAYYGETAEDLMDPFREEFDLLSAICGRKLRLRLEPNHGVEIKVLNLYRTDAEGRAMLPDLAYDSVAWALLRVRVPAALPAMNASGLVHVLSANVEYDDGDGNARATNMAHVRLERAPATAYAAMAEDEVVVARALELRAAELLTEARAAARRQDWDSVDSLMATAQRVAGENQWVAATTAVLQQYASQRDEERFSKEAYFSSRKKRERLASLGESALYDPSTEAVKPGYARRKPVQGKDLSGDRGAN